MFAFILFILFVLFSAFVTRTAYTLGKTKTENARLAAIFGFLLSFIPVFALIYLLVLFLKNDVDIV